MDLSEALELLNNMSITDFGILAFVAVYAAKYSVHAYLFLKNGKNGSARVPISGTPVEQVLIIRDIFGKLREISDRTDRLPYVESAILETKGDVQSILEIARERRDDSSKS
jgi:hypothetical protein